MALQKVTPSPAVQLHEAIFEVQETALRNTQLDCNRLHVCMEVNYVIS